MDQCRHCGEDIPTERGESGFCCKGCQAAHDLIKGWGLGRYYERRAIDPKARRLRPANELARVDFEPRTIRTTDSNGRSIATLHLMVDGLHCAACVWLIETVLSRQPGIIKARLNMTTRRLVVVWDMAQNSAENLMAPVMALGYRLVPFDPVAAGDASERQRRELLKAMAVAGFAAANVMLLSVSVWAGHASGMSTETRSLLHWFSALIALPAIAYAGRPFFRSAVSALTARRTNMDVPISLAVILTGGMSLVQTMEDAQHAYFDSAVGLLFFLLIGRYLDRRARGRAREVGSRLLVLGAGMATVLDPDGGRRMLPPDQVQPGQTVLVAAGERIPIDGEIVQGESEIDTALITGESIPTPAGPGDAVLAGTINLGSPLRVTARAAGENTVLAEITRLMEAAEQGRARYVSVADRVSRWYAPVVHFLALMAFFGWWGLVGLHWQPALLIAVSVLIITCPCALALAVPAVQVIAAGRLLKRGILLKSGTALERLAVIDRVVFDKTGTLTQGHPQLLDPARHDAEDLAAAAVLAAASKHPLARALLAVAPPVPVAEDVVEHPGLGLSAGKVRLGRRSWIGLPDDGGLEMELWLDRPGRTPVRFGFTDRPRTDAAQVVKTLKSWGLPVNLLSGDRPTPVRAIAGELAIEAAQSGLTPDDKLKRLGELGGRVLMVGDGLNDAPALAAAYVSMSPSTAAHVSQTAADLVFQGDLLEPVTEAIATARLADRLVKQNFALAFGYNVITIPLALAGLVTPLIAAIAMSTSSLLVIGNAMRLAAASRD